MLQIAKLVYECGLWASLIDSRVEYRRYFIGIESVRDGSIVCNRFLEFAWEQCNTALLAAMYATNRFKGDRNLIKIAADCIEFRRAAGEVILDIGGDIERLLAAALGREETCK